MQKYYRLFTVLAAIWLVSGAALSQEQTSTRLALSADIGRHYQRISTVIDDLNILDSPYPDLVESYMVGISIAKTQDHLIQRLSGGLSSLAIVLSIPKEDFLSTRSSVSQQYAYLSYAIGRAKRFGDSKLGYEVTAGVSAFISLDQERSSPENWPSGNYQGRNESSISFRDAKLNDTPAARLGGQIQGALSYPLIRKVDISIWSSAMLWLGREYRTSQMTATVDDAQSGRVQLNSYMPSIAWGLRISVDI